jgi:hypothetical protein
MKYALVSEAQIKQIEDALTAASYVPRGVMYPAGYHMQIAQALNSMSALKPQEPVAFGVMRENGNGLRALSLNRGVEIDLNWIPLFALEQT